MATSGSSRDLPIDRGWSWVICFASFLCMFIVGTSMQALSVLFLELVTEFESSVTVTSLTVMCFVMSLSVSSVVSTSVIVPRFGERPVVVVSGAVFAIFSIGYFLAPNIIVFIVFAAGKGTCVGMIFVPSVSLLSCYFNRRRSLAVTISNSGICVASIVSPPIIRAVTAYYGMRGTFLILAAVELHMIAAGLLMRPVSSYRSLPTNENLNSDLAEEELTLIKDMSEKSDKNLKAEIVTDIETKENILSSSVTKGGILKTSIFSDTKNGKVVSLNDLPYDSRDPRTNENLLQNTENVIENRDISPPMVSSSRRGSRKDSTTRKESLSDHSFHGSNSSLHHAHRHNAVHRESMWSVTSGLEPAVTGIGLQHKPDDENHQQGWKSCCCIDILRRIFDPYLFSQWAYRVFLLSCIPSATTQYLMQYIPTIAVIKGATKDQGATLMTIVGSVDLVSRLAVGVFADMKILKTTHIVAISQICEGILCQFNPLFDTFEKMIVMVVFLGLFIGTRQSLMAMMHIDIVGMEKMARCLSISAMVATISAACHSPLLSAIMEATGSYDIVLHYVGGALIVGAVLISSTSLVARVDTRRQAKNLT